MYKNVSGSVFMFQVLYVNDILLIGCLDFTICQNLVI